MTIEELEREFARLLQEKPTAGNMRERRAVDIELFKAREALKEHPNEYEALTMEEKIAKLGGSCMSSEEAKKLGIGL